MHFASFSNISLETFVPSLTSLTCSSLQILGKTQTGVFPISGQTLIKINCHNSRTSDDIDMKLEPITKLDKRNKNYWKNWRRRHVGKWWRNCHFCELWPIWKNSDSGCIVFKTYILNNSNLLSCKNWKQFATQLSSHIIALSKVLFLPAYQEMLIFCKKMLISTKLRGSWC